MNRPFADHAALLVTTDAACAEREIHPNAVAMNAPSTEAVARNLHVVEFSFSQRTVHVTTLGESLASNARAFIENRPADYIPLAVFESREAASEACRQVQAARDAREEVRGL